jgi:hypothetical protein
MVKVRPLLALVFSLFATAALAQPQPGPGPAPDPWVVSGQQISYGGCVLVPVTAAAGCQGAGTISTNGLFLSPSTAASPSFVIQPGVTPTSPVNGAIWITNSGMFVEIAGVTIGPLAQGAGGSFAATPPLGVTFPGSVVTYALSYNASLANFSGSLGVNPANANVFTVGQGINANSASLQAAQTGTLLQIGQADGVTTRVELDSYAAASRFTCVRADGTAANQTALLTGDEICSLNAFGVYNSATHAIGGPAAAIRTYANQNWTNAGRATYIDIAATPQNSTALTEIATFQASSTGGGYETIFNSGIGATSTEGLLLSNATPATSGAQQWSPRLHLQGQGFATTPIASLPVDWIVEVQPAQGSSAPSSNLVFSTQVGGGGYQVAGYLTSGGVIDVATGIIVNNTAAPSGYVLRGNGAAFVSAQLGAADLNNGVTGSGAVVLANGASLSALTVTTSFTATGLVTLADLAPQPTNTVLANATSGPISPTAFGMPSCSGAGNALIWTTNIGFGCVSVTAAASSVTAGTTVVNGGPGVLQNSVSGGTLISSLNLPSGLAATNMTLTTPALGVATATSINGLTITPSTGTLTITNAKTFAVTASLTLAGTNGTTMTAPGASDTLAGLGTIQTFSAANTFSSTLNVTGTFEIGGTAVALPISLANGGSNASLVASNGGVVYSTATGFAILPGTATANLCLISQSNTAPVWAACLAGGAVSGPGSSTNNDIATWNGTSGTVLADSGVSIASGNINLSSIGSYQINGSSVLSSSTLGAGVTGSSLTSVGTISTGVWHGTVIAGTYGGTGVNNGSNTITVAGNFSTSAALAITAGSANQIAYWVSGTAMAGATPASLSATPATPTGTNNTTGLMMGLGGTCAIAPVFSGRILVSLVYSETVSVAASSPTTKLRYGTGTAPSNGAALTGTQIGNTQLITVSAGWYAGSLGGVVTGLTVGTTYWLDIGLASSSSSSTASLSDITCIATEF